MPKISFHSSRVCLWLCVTLLLSRSGEQLIAPRPSLWILTDYWHCRRVRNGNKLGDDGESERTETSFCLRSGCAKVERKQHEWSLSEEGKSLEHFPCTTAEEAVRPVITILMYVTVSHGPEPFVLLSPPPLSTEKRSEATWLMSDMLFHKLLAQGQEWTFNL